ARSECVFEETNAQTDEATAAQMIALLGLCGSFPGEAEASLEASAAAAFPAEVRLHAFIKVLAVWGYYRQSHTLRACAQVALNQILDYCLVDLGSPARAELLRLILGHVSSELGPALLVERAMLYLRCLQRVALHPAARRWASAEHPQVSFFRSEIPLLLLSFSKHFSTRLPVLALLLPVVNRICWLCVDHWSTAEAGGQRPSPTSVFGALQVEALFGGVYLRSLGLAVPPLLAAPDAPSEASELLELLLESLCDLLQPELVRALWLSFDGDWRRPPLVEQVVARVVELLGAASGTERPLPPHLAQLSSAVLARVVAAFVGTDSVVQQGRSRQTEANGCDLDSVRLQWRQREAVCDLMAKIEENPKKARAAFDKSGLSDITPLPSLGGLAEGEDGSEEWARKLIWMLRCQNHVIPYAAVGEFFGQPKDDSEKAIAAFVDTFDWGAADIEQALRGFLEVFLLPKEAQQIDRVLKTF
ncbi:unnamed protein product, partial [Polarella glacialis]